MIDAEDRIINLDIEGAMKTAYIDYSMSVIVSQLCPMCVMASNLYIAVCYMP